MNEFTSVFAAARPSADFPCPAQNNQTMCAIAENAGSGAGCTERVILEPDRLR
jgi:hypothetical protein